MALLLLLERRAEGVPLDTQHVEVFSTVQRQVVQAVVARAEEPFFAQGHSRSGWALYLAETVFEGEVIMGTRGGRAQDGLGSRVGAPGLQPAVVERLCLSGPLKHVIYYVGLEARCLILYW